MQIFLEYHLKGLASLACQFPICLDAAMIKQPFCDCELARVAKEASLKETKPRSFNGLLWMVILVSL